MKAKLLSFLFLISFTFISFTSYSQTTIISYTDFSVWSVSGGGDTNGYTKTPYLEQTSDGGCAYLVADSPVFSTVGFDNLSISTDIINNQTNTFIRIEYSPDGGVNYYPIGSIGQGVNWYNNTTGCNSNNDGYDGWEGVMAVTAQLSSLSSSLNNNSNVKLRIYIDMWNDGGYARLDNLIISGSTITPPPDTDGDGTIDSLDKDSDNDGIPNVLDGCSTADLENTVGLGNSLNWDTYTIEGTDIQYGPTISDGTITTYSGGNLGSAIRIKGQSGESNNTYKFDTFFSNDVEYLTFKITDFDSDEDVSVAAYDENDNIYDLTTVGVVSVGSFITQTGNQFVANSPNNNIDGANDAEDIYGSVSFYFPGKVSRIDIYGSISYDASISVSEFNYCLNDFDNDGVKDFLDLDSDNDGIPDIVEAGGIDTDKNGVSDSLVDYNNNGISDIYDTNCINSTSASGNADTVVTSSSVTSQSNILGVQDFTDAVIAPGGSITVDLTDTVPVNYLVIIKQQRTSGSGNVPFTVEQSINPTTSFINSDSFTTQDVSGYYSSSYRISTSDARYIRITNTDASRDIGIDYLSYDFGSLTDCNGTLGNSIPLLNSDSDSNSNWLDLDSDNDGIPDNVEAQSTLGYTNPNVAVNSDGLNTSYLSLPITDTDGDEIFDFIDSDSDNDGTPDIQENGMSNTLANADTDNDGLDNAFEGGNMNDFYDVNDEIDNPSSDLPDTDTDVFSGGDVDYRDLFDVNPPSSATLDFDGIDDYVEVSTSLINSLDEFTISFWIKPESLPTGSVFDRRFIIGQKDMFEIALGPNNDNEPHIWTRHFYGAGPSANGTGIAINGTDWMQYTVTVDYIVESIRIYVNGAFFTSMGMNGPRLTNINPFRIGSSSDAQPAIDENFEGWIDEIRIFNTQLTTDQIQRMVYQEIKDNSGNVHGTVIPKDIIDINTDATIPWNNLIGYYPMTNIQTGKITDESVNNNTATLHNITTLLPQTAPMPFETKADGDWTEEATWLHGDVWDIEDFEGFFTQAYQKSPEAYSIVKIHNNVSTSDSHTQLGMFIDDDRTLTVNDDNAISNSWYLELNGTIDLQDDSQLTQSINSDLVTSASGKILRRQEGNSNYYWYNYWCSPVGSLAATTLNDNNGVTTNPNNTPFSFNMLKDGAGSPVTFTTAYNEAGKVSSRWLYTFQNGLTYWNWTALNQNSPIQQGFGYTQKGTQNTTGNQQYIFEGKPNNGTILIDADDVDGDAAGVGESVKDATLTTTLIGNPYPSALDAQKFIADNVGVISGTILLWEQWAGNSHNLSEYQGGYGYINDMTTARAYQHADIPIADQVQTQGIKTPTNFIPVGQGFFVEVINDGNIEFNNGQRVFKRESLNESIFFRASNTETSTNTEVAEEENPFQLIRLEFGTSQGSTRHFVLGFGDEATDGLDYGLDGGLIIDKPEDDMGSLLDGDQYVIQALTPITADKEVDLNLNASGNYTYSLKIVELQNIEEEQEIYLRDNLIGTYFDLRNEQVYNFTSDAGEFADRFDIVFQLDSTLSNDDFAVEDTIVYVNNSENILYVKGLSLQAKQLTITNMLGQTIKTYNNIDNQLLENGINISDLSSGSYIVSVLTNNNQNIDKKVIIN